MEGWMDGWVDVGDWGLNHGVSGWDGMGWGFCGCSCSYSYGSNMDLGLSKRVVA